MLISGSARSATVNVTAPERCARNRAVLGSIWHPRISVAINAGAPLKIQWNQNMIQLQCFALVNGAIPVSASISGKAAVRMITRMV